MNTANDTVRVNIRPLTTQQCHFVCLILEGYGKSEAYRISYSSSADPHGISSQAHRLASSPAVKAALARAEKGDFSGLIICRGAFELLALKKIANNPATPCYVRVRALQALLEYQRTNPEPEKPKKPPTLEELERFLQAECGEKPAAAHRRNGFDELDEI